MKRSSWNFSWGKLTERKSQIVFPFFCCVWVLFFQCAREQNMKIQNEIYKKKILQQIIVYRKIFEKKSVEFPEKFTNFLVHWEVKKEGRRKLENRKHFANFVNLFVVCVFLRTVIFFWYFLWKECCRKKKTSTEFIKW